MKKKPIDEQIKHLDRAIAKLELARFRISHRGLNRDLVEWLIVEAIDELEMCDARQRLVTAAHLKTRR
jgi:hypothetical protein